MRWQHFATVTAVVMGLIVGACKDAGKDDEDDTNPFTTGDDDDATGDDDDAPGDDDDVTGDDDDTMGDDDDDDVQCWVPGPIGECYDCEPPASPGTDSDAFLNACDNDTSYALFDNASRIPSATWVPGSPLPSLP
jgi:hypothetical protein